LTSLVLIDLRAVGVDAFALAVVEEEEEGPGFTSPDDSLGGIVEVEEPMNQG